jgi:mannan endo-1,6-alpha-mannosidase
MRSTLFITAIVATTSLVSAQMSFISVNKIAAVQIARSLTASFPNPSIALVAPPYWWWQSGSIIDGLLTYSHVTGDKLYNDLLANTMLSQKSGSNDFMTPDATGNDDQAWWGLAAMSAAEYGLPNVPGQPTWLDLARNVFNTQKGRWRTDRCNGGLKWKINPSDPGFTYRSTISNGLFFQLAARLARFTNDADTLSWATKSYDWSVSVGLVSSQFDVFDGTDDSKGVNGCVDVNHDQWSYNTAAFLYGAAVMAAHTKEQIWMDRTNGFIGAAQRNFIKNEQFFEKFCQGSSSGCNTDQTSFKAVLARWMGTTATILPATKGTIAGVMGGAVKVVDQGWNAGMGVMEQFMALEIVDALSSSVGSTGLPAVLAVRRKRSVAGRVWM